LVFAKIKNYCNFSREKQEGNQFPSFSKKQNDILFVSHNDQLKNASKPLANRSSNFASSLSKYVAVAHIENY